MKINNFQGDLTDVSFKTEALIFSVSIVNVGVMENVVSAYLLKDTPRINGLLCQPKSVSRYHVVISASFLAEISVRSPRNLFIYITVV